MGRKQSSFHMGNEFNGNGEVRYLKGTQPCIHPPVSQENVQLTPDFGNYLLKVLGSIPVAISPLNINPALFALLGSMASVTQVIITKDPVTGNYDFKFKIISPQDFTNGSYPYTFQIMDNQIPIAMGVADGWVPVGDKWKYFKNGGYLTHTWHKINGLWYYFHSDGIMASYEWIETGGKWYFVHHKGDMAVDQWVKTNDKWYYVGKNGVMYSNERKMIGGKWYFFHKEGDMALNERIEDPDTGKTYWADEDGELSVTEPEAENGREITFPDIIDGEVNGKEFKLEPNKRWFAFKSNGNGIIKDRTNTYHKISVGPSILNPDYPDSGRLWADDFGGDLKVRVDVVLKEIATGKEKTLECIATGIKAHTYSFHPDATEGCKHKLFSYNKNITASFDFDNGYIQTGIAYPNSSNGQKDSKTDGPIAMEHMDGSSIEFTGTSSELHKNGKKESDYELVKIIVKD